MRHLVGALLVACLPDCINARLLLRQQLHGCPVNGRVICQSGEVTVIANDANERLLRFQDECATESRVHCQGDLQLQAGTCDGDCRECPCQFDASKGLSANYMQTMFQQLAPVCSNTGSSRILMIGLGGAELPQYLHAHCPQMFVEAVELNPAVIDVAQRYFGLASTEAANESAEHPRLVVEHGDAEAAVQERLQKSLHGQYDAVLIDCFAGHGDVPETCRSESLAEGVRGILKPGGLLLQNIWDFSPNHPEVAEAFSSTVGLYSKVFGDQLSVLEVPMPPRIAWVKVLRGEVVASTA
mmetsp:Transcript_38942/g.70903  ORF Transcript_38942/g.70903 Transcript_38942/m.70903 type:complete len:298 (+) Transcript_38942:40-933(+)